MRHHIKTFQNNQYAKADCIKRATMALNSNYNNPSLRLFEGFKRYSIL